MGAKHQRDPEASTRPHQSKSKAPAGEPALLRMSTHSLGWQLSFPMSHSK